MIFLILILNLALLPIQTTNADERRLGKISTHNKSDYRNQLAQSQKLWLKQAHKNYQYRVHFSSWVGFGSETRIVAHVLWLNHGRYSVILLAACTKDHVLHRQ